MRIPSLSGWPMATACLAMLAWGVSAQAQELTRPIRVVHREGAEAQGEHYFIGVAVEQEGNKLQVERVLEGSPAAKAGLKSGDVLVSVNDKKLEQVSQLTQAIAASHGRKLTLVAMRNGDRKKVEVTPSHRAAIAVFEREEDEDEEGGEGDDDDEAEEREHLLQRLQQQAKVQGVLNSLVRKIESGSAIPADMKICIEKQGSHAARIEVTQGEQLWRTTEKHLEMLPPAARAYVGNILRQPARANLPGAAAQARRMEFHVREGREGQPQVIRAGGAPGTVKRLPGGGIQIQLHEEGEEKGEGKRPAPGASLKPRAGASLPGAVKRLPGGGLQIRINEGGEEKGEGKRPAPGASLKPRAGAALPGAVKQLPGGGIQIQLRKGGEEKGEGKARPAPNPRAAGGVTTKAIPGGVKFEIREGQGENPGAKVIPWKELKKPSATEHELRDEIERLRREIERLRKS